MINVEPINLVVLKTYNTEFDEIVITFTDPISKHVEIEERVDLESLINK